jgi:hypothetical protein
MTLYLYDDATKDFIGQLSTRWLKEQIPSGTLIIYEKTKYVVVTSTPTGQPNSFNVTVNRA